MLNLSPDHYTWGRRPLLLAGLFAFNTMRELQMQTQPSVRKTIRQRMTLWAFGRVEPICKTVFQRASRRPRPKESWP